MSGSSGSTESVPEADGLPDGLEDGDQVEGTCAAAVLPQAGLQVKSAIRTKRVDGARALSYVVHTPTRLGLPGKPQACASRFCIVSLQQQLFVEAFTKPFKLRYRRGLLETRLSVSISLLSFQLQQAWAGAWVY